MKAAILTIILSITVIVGLAQCPTAGSTLFSNTTISSDCTVSGNLTIQGPTLTIDPGVTLTVTGTLTIQGDATISASSTSNINISGDLRDNWTGGGTNSITGGTYNITGDLVEASGGNFTIDNAVVNADSAYTSDGANLQILNGSNIVITKGMRNQELLTINASILDIGGDLDATGGDNVTVRNNGELIVRGNYKMNNGGGVQLNLETGGLVRIFGDVESNTGGNTIDVDGDSGISVGGDFTGGSPPDVSVGTDDEDADCLTGGGCCGDASACSGATTLPVSLIDFRGDYLEGELSFEWHTASETNNDFFILEQSYDGVLFNEVARIKGNGTTNEVTNYSFTSKRSTNVKGLFYRLSQTDFDGTHEKLKIIYVSFSTLDRGLSIYPNPVHEGRKMTIEGLYSDNSKWEIYSLTGEKVSEGSFDSNNQMDVPGLVNGSYILSVNALDKVVQKRFIVR
ncbi:MAG: T9SS type A sorting domain-containing protein [Ekhidna sp.]